MSTEENKALVRRWFEDGFNAHNLAIMNELFAPDFVEHTSYGPPTQSRDAARQGLAGSFTAMPDMRVTVEDMIAEGDKVVTRFIMQGTQRGAFMGIPATDKAVTTTNIAIMRFENGKIAENWVESDTLGMMRQLGVIPAPGQAPS